MYRISQLNRVFIGAFNTQLSHGLQDGRIGRAKSKTNGLSSETALVKLCNFFKIKFSPLAGVAQAISRLLVSDGHMTIFTKPPIDTLYRDLILIGQGCCTRACDVLCHCITQVYLGMQVVTHMRRRRHKTEVLQAIIRFIAIFVVDILSPFKHTPQMLLHDKSVDILHFATDHSAPISMTFPHTLSIYQSDMNRQHLGGK